MPSLEKFANIAVIITCVAVGGSWIHRTYLSRPLVPAPYKTGDRLKDTEGLVLSRADRTLVLITASTCHFCTESMPPLARLVTYAVHAGVRVIGATFEDLSTNKTYLQEHGVAVDAVVSLRGNGLRDQPTPSFLLVRKDGTVLGSWRGKLDSAREQELLAGISGHR